MPPKKWIKTIEKNSGDKVKLLAKILKWTVFFISIPITYLFISLIFSLIPVNSKKQFSNQSQSIFINSNGVHSNIIIYKDLIDPKLLKGIRFLENECYFSFGWGDREFYLNTPEWSDLTFKNAVNACFFKSSTLIHLSRYSSIQHDWIKIVVNPDQLEIINKHIFESFKIDFSQNTLLLENKGYSFNDDFYQANGSYSCFKTSNTWVNLGLKKAGIKACLWTPFDFGILRLHKK
ncbi:MAG: DUF2459 domain-containing protein [Bacteroidota bacterium]